MKKKMWHCKYCGNTQDANEPVCRGCGNDLVIYGDIVFVDTPDAAQTPVQPEYQQHGMLGETPVSSFGVNNEECQGMNNGGAPVYHQGGFGGYQQGMNNGGTPAYHQGGFGGYQQGMNNGSTPGYQQGINNGGAYAAMYEPPYSQPVINNDGQNKKGDKKGIIALIAVALVAIVAVVTVLLLSGDKDKDRDTTKKYDYSSSTTVYTTSPSTTSQPTTKPSTSAPTTTKPVVTTTPSPSGNLVSVPSFYAFAEEHMVRDLEYSESTDGTVDIYTYYMRQEYIGKIAIEYIKLLVNKYDFTYSSDSIVSEGNTYVVMFQYIGSGSPSTFQYSHNGRTYTGELFFGIDFDTNSVIFCVSDGIDVNVMGDVTSYDVVDFSSPVLPDFEEFAYDYIISVDDESDGTINDYYYTLPASEGEAIIDEYADLILDYHNFDVIQSVSDENWIGLEYCGSQSVGTFVTTFGDGSKSESTAVTLSYTYDSDGNIVFNLAYIDDVRIVKALLVY